MEKSKSDGQGIKDTQVGGDNLVTLLLSRIDNLATDLKSIKEENKTLISKVDSSEKFLKQTLSALQKDTVLLKKEVSKLKKANNLLIQENNKGQIQLNSLEQFTRFNGIRITNIPVYNKDENLYEIIEIISHQIGFNCNIDDLECFRIKLRNEQFIPPIILKFVKLKDKHTFMKLLRERNFKLTTEIFEKSDHNRPIYFSENMSPFYSSFFKKAKLLKSKNIIKFVWFRSNKLYVKVTEQSKPTVISCDEDLEVITAHDKLKNIQERKLSEDVDVSDLDTDVSESSSITSFKKRKLLTAQSNTLDSFFSSDIQSRKMSQMKNVFLR